MKRSTMIISMCTVACMIVIVSCSLSSEPESKNTLKAVTSDSGYTTIGPGTYQSFIKNWDAEMDPILYAAIQSTQQWNTIFHPAPVMGGSREFGPTPEIFEGNILLIVARVTKGGTGDDIFRLQELVTEGETVEMRYTFSEPEGEATYTAKEYLGVVVPRGTLATVRFIENGTQIGELDIENGEWCIPQP